MDVNLRQLRAFVSIGRLSSFTKAAEALHTTQPNLSAQVRELEEALGVRLFDRNTRSVSLTRAGEDLLPVVDQVLADLRSVVERANDVATRNTGRVSIAALPSVAAIALPQALANFRARYPGIKVGLRDALADRALELVRSGEVDFGVTSAIGRDPKLEFVLLGRDSIVAVTPPDHPIARMKKPSLEALLEHPLILMDRDSSVRHIVDAAYASLRRLVVPEYEATYMSSAIGMVRAGLGVTLLPSSAFEVSVATELAVRSLNNPLLERRIGIVRLKGRSLSPAAEALAAALVEHAKSWAPTRRAPTKIAPTGKELSPKLPAPGIPRNPRRKRAR